MSSLAKVNGEVIETATALRVGILHDDTFLKNTITNALIRQYAEKHNIRNTDQELQLAADELRYSRGLESVDTVTQWMRESHQTALSVQEGIDIMLLHNKVRNAIPEAEIATYYAEHQLDLETVELYSIRLETADKANEILAQINDEGANFQALALEHSQDKDSRHLGGYVGNLTRSQMTGEVEAAVFRAKPISVIGPVKTHNGYNLFKVAVIHRPSLEESKSLIRVKLMEQLTAKLLAEANIEYSVFEAETAASA
jgi:parvulin-like peptidyl-prolyl isomerase